MTEKEAMLFAYQQSAEPMIKNKVLRDALDKDLGPRNTYAQGQLVSNTVDGSRPGYSGNPLKKYKMTSSGRRLGVTVQSFVPVSSKIKKYIYKDDVTGELITVFKVKITDQPSNKGGTMKAGESGNYKTLLVGPDKTEFTTLGEAESARTEYYKKNPGKRIKDLNKDKISKDNRRSDIKKNEGVESYKTGDGDVVKGHSSNIKGKNKIQPDNLIYTNKDINALMANTKGEVDKVNPTPYDSLDFKQREAETEIERIKKSKLPPAEKKRLLAIQDNKLVEYVGMSDGYKTAVLSDGTTYGTSFRSLQSMDPFNEFPGMSEKEVKEFVGEYFTQDRMKNDKLEYGTLKPKYAKLSKKEMQALPQSVKDNIVKAYTFNENVKLAKVNAGKAASKFKIRMMDFCEGGMAGGGVAGVCSMKEARAGLKKQIAAATKASKNGKIPKRFGKLRNFATNVFGLLDIPIEALLVLPEITAGNTEAAINNTTLGWFGYGKFDVEKVKEVSPQAYQYLKDSQATEEYTAAADTVERFDAFFAQAKKDGTLDKIDPAIVEQYENAKLKMNSIVNEYQNYGYTDDDPTKTPVTGKVATQNYLRNKVKSDWEKRQEKKRNQSEADYEASGLEFDKDPNKKVLQYEDVYKAPTDLKSFIDQKGELGKDTMLQYGVRKEAERVGKPGIFDNFVLGMDTEYAGGKDIEDLYSDLPIEYASQLASLEKEDLEQGLAAIQQKEDDEFISLTGGAAEGGIMNLRRKR